MKFYLAAVLALWNLSASCLAADDSAKIKCGDLGRKFAADFKKEYVNAVSLWGNPEFYYSSSLGTCLAYTEITDGALNKDITAVWYYRRITDVYTNKVLSYSRFFVTKKDAAQKPTLVNLGNVGDAVNLLPEAFAARKAELFSP